VQEFCFNHSQKVVASVPSEPPRLRTVHHEHHYVPQRFPEDAMNLVLLRLAPTVEQSQRDLTVASSYDVNMFNVYTLGAADRWDGIARGQPATECPRKLALSIHAYP
jgi:hypothetical protein